MLLGLWSRRCPGNMCNRPFQSPGRPSLWSKRQRRTGCDSLDNFRVSRRRQLPDTQTCTLHVRDGIAPSVSNGARPPLVLFVARSPTSRWLWLLGSRKASSKFRGEQDERRPAENLKVAGWQLTMTTVECRTDFTSADHKDFDFQVPVPCMQMDG